VTAHQPKESYPVELGRALRAGDAEQLRAFLIQNARSFGNQDQAEELAAQSRDQIEALMHRMTLARADLGELHEASRAALGEGKSGRHAGPTSEVHSRRRGPQSPPDSGARGRL
jgi:hypothetical protein